MSKIALIVGVSGQDGAYLAKLLLEKGYSVYGSSRDAQVASFSNLKRLNIFELVHKVSTSPADFHSVLSTLSAINPTEVYNLSGQSSVGLSFEQPVETFNSIAIANLTWLEAIRFYNKKIKYYYAGSSECFGNTEKPATEETLFRPKSPYAVAKATAFWQVANYRDSYGLQVCSGILFNHESPLRPERFVTQKIVRTACRIAKGSKEKLQLGNIDICRDWGWAPDYVEAMWLMLQQEKPNDYVIATGHMSSLKDFVRNVFETLGLAWEEHVHVEEGLMRPSDIDISVGCPEKAKIDLGWRPALLYTDVAKHLVQAELYRLERLTRNNQG